MAKEFRGKRVDNGEWIYSDSIIRLDGRVGLVDESKGSSLDEGRVAEVRPETLGRCARYICKDCGDAERSNMGFIYTDDIIQHEELGIKLVCCFTDGAFCARLLPERKRYSRLELLLTSAYNTIGNVHDNPELLKGGEGDSIA